MIKKVLRTVKKYELLNRGDRVVIALSGGADSVFLLYALNKIKKLYSLKLYIAHLNHQLRKKADEDAEFVREIAKTYKIPCIIEKRDVKNYAKERKLSLEEGARELRYNFLESVADKFKANKIAIGHTITDEAETLIFRLVRGTGLKGLALIPPKRDKIIRPLIEIEHNEILGFLKKTGLSGNGITYRKDYSNYRTNHTRNFIRYKIMPPINMLVPDFSKKSMRLREIIEAENKFLEKITGEKFKKLCHRQGGIPIRRDKGEKQKIIINLKDFSKEDLAIKRRIVRKIGENLGYIFSFEETENIVNKFQNPKSKFPIKFKIQSLNSIYVKIQNGIISFELSNKLNKLNGYPVSKNQPNELKFIDFPVPGELRIPTRLSGWGEIKLRAQICNNAQLKTATKDKVYFDFDKLAFPLFVRGRKNGDVFRGGGSTSGNDYHKKLKELFIDDKVPRETRDLIPLLLDQNGILWVIKHRRSSTALVDKGTRRILKIEAMAG